MIDRNGYRPRGGRKIMAQHQSGESQAPIGLVAGWGSFPVQVAESLIRDGHRVCCIAISGHASTDLESLCDHVRWSGVGKLGGHIRYFRRNGVKQVTMAGKLFKADLLYQGSLWLRHFPDLTCIRTLGPALLGRQRDARDDSLLVAVTNAYDHAGMEVLAATDFAPELLVKPGNLTNQKLTKANYADIEFGWKLAKDMGGLDVGQSVVVKRSAVLAVEAVEGTDECIRRAGQLCPAGGFTVVKVAKPNQDMRFDVPTVGLGTLQTIHAAGGSVLAIEAHKTIILEQQAMIEFAAKHGIAIVALESKASHIYRAA